MFLDQSLIVLLYLRRKKEAKKSLEKLNEACSCRIGATGNRINTFPVTITTRRNKGTFQQWPFKYIGRPVVE